MRIVLVNPPPHKIMEAFYDTPPFPRPALAFLAAYLRENGISVEVVDSKYSRLDYDGTMERIKSFSPDIVGTTAMTNEVIQAGEVARRVKNWNPAIVTVIGGAHVSAIPERTLREFPFFDFAILGEGEEPLLNLTRAVERGLEKSLAIPGVAKILGGSYHFGGNTQKCAFDTLPLPAWDLFEPAKEYMLHTSRGCPYHCLFCMNFHGRTVRQAPAQKVLDEIEHLVTFSGVKSVIFGDEIFTINRDRTVEICDGLIARGLNRIFTWWCVSHVRCMDYELAVLMKKAGCRMVGLGIEAGSDERLAQISKGTTRAGILETTRNIRRAGLPFEAYSMLGYPEETLETAKQTVDFLIEINPDQPVIGIMVPYPGTRIAAMAEKGEGGYVLSARSWNDYNKQIGDAICFRNLTRKQLERLQLWGYVKVFLLNFRIAGFLMFSWRYRLLAWRAVLKAMGLNREANRKPGNKIGELAAAQVSR